MRTLRLALVLGTLVLGMALATPPAQADDDDQGTTRYDFEDELEEEAEEELDAPEDLEEEDLEEEDIEEFDEELGEDFEEVLVPGGGR